MEIRSHAGVMGRVEPTGIQRKQIQNRMDKVQTEQRHRERKKEHIFVITGAVDPIEMIAHNLETGELKRN